jgi:hypothetical protein
VKLVDAIDATKSAEGEREADDLEPVSVVCSASPQIGQKIEERRHDCAAAETDRKSIASVHVTKRPKAPNDQRPPPETLGRLQQSLTSRFAMADIQTWDT